MVIVDSKTLKRQLTLETDERDIAYFSILADSDFTDLTTILFTQATINVQKTLINGVW